jgi:hypothetical protein
MAAKTSTARKRTAARRRKTTPRGRSAAAARRVKIPRRGPIHARLGTWMALRIVTRFADHHDVIRSRKDAAILRATHKGCPTCHGNGQIYTKDKKTGAFTGAKRCPAPPTKETVSRWEINRAARMGGDKRTGLVGWSCPCGKKEKPRYRDAKEATKALRAHEKQKHGGKSVGGTWYAQAAEGAGQAQKPQPVPSKVVANSGMTDEQWIKQNKKVHPGKAIAQGVCWMCAGDGKLHGAFGGQQILAVCPECKGTGKPAVAAAK